ncbi:hypothetical protein [Pseudomonas viridiflava]|uniref:hypothetical protein n=1 Tax=Pseudomonas viridiflava TaxID=33069 RepID=UPI0013CF0330|nr:hypothetical protein [Pseudomonas viridiflava]
MGAELLTASCRHYRLQRIDDERRQGRVDAAKNDNVTRDVQALAFDELVSPHLDVVLQEGFGTGPGRKGGFKHRIDAFADCFQKCVVNEVEYHLLDKTPEPARPASQIKVSGGNVCFIERISRSGEREALQFISGVEP